MKTIQEYFLDSEGFLREYIDDNELLFEYGEVEPFTMLKDKEQPWAKEIMSIYTIGDNNKTESLLVHLIKTATEGSLQKLKYRTLLSKQKNGVANEEFIKARQIAIKLKATEDDMISKISSVIAIMQSIKNGHDITDSDIRYLASKCNLDGITSSDQTVDEVIAQVVEEYNKEQLRMGGERENKKRPR